MFFDAFGRLAFGQDTQGTSDSYLLPAVAGIYSVAGAAAAFGRAGAAAAGTYLVTGATARLGAAEPASAGAYVLAGRPTEQTVSLAPAAASYSLTGLATSFGAKQPAGAGAYALIGCASGLTVGIATLPGVHRLTGYGAAWPLVWNVAGSSYDIVPPDTPLLRSGADVDLVYGGVGHYLEELERQRQLAKITRKTPQPIRSKPWPSLPAAQRPSTVAAVPLPPDLPSIAAQRLTEPKQAQAAVRRAKALEILLLAS
jgi:hypothetical protein